MTSSTQQQANDAISPVEGRLSILIDRSGQAKNRVTIHSSRPLKASHLFIGKTPEQALLAMPLLYGICSTAQCRAAVGCLQRALKFPENPQIETARDMLVLVETAREHLLRLFIDWPRLLDLPAETAALPAIGRLLDNCKQALFIQGEAFNLNSILQGKPNALEQHIDTLESLLQQHVFRIPPRQWLDLTGICQLHTWSQTEDSIAAEALLTICNQAWASQGISRCAALPDIDDTAMQERLTQPDAQKFVEQPEWQQSCRETGAFTRQADQPLIRALCQEFDATLLPRWTARLVELARIPQQLRNMLGGLQPDTTTPQSNADEAGNGLKQVEAARGRLTHHVQLSNGIITRYRIVSPTEWNFHPQGVATQSLANLTHSKQPDIEQTAHLLINAIDPCVSYQLRIH